MLYVTQGRWSGSCVNSMHAAPSVAHALGLLGSSLAFSALLEGSAAVAAGVFVAGSAAAGVGVVAAAAGVVAVSGAGAAASPHAAAAEEACTHRTQTHRSVHITHIRGHWRPGGHTRTRCCNVAQGSACRGRGE